MVYLQNKVQAVVFFFFFRIKALIQGISSSQATSDNYSSLVLIVGILIVMSGMCTIVTSKGRKSVYSTHKYSTVLPPAERRTLQ